MSFAARVPSTTWEPVALPDAPGQHVWVWYKPQGMPDGLIVTIPDETWAACAHGGPLTMRKLFHALGIAPAWVTRWYLYGVPCESLGGTSPLLDQPLPPPAPGADPRIAICVASAPVPGPVSGPVAFAPAQPMPMPAAYAGMSGPAGAAPMQLFARIESDWNAILQIEANLALMRKQVGGMLGRINGLNRDLTPDERLHGDRKDKSDWQVARRWLRDVAAKLSRCMKDHDLGHTSAAGKRNAFEQTYRDFIAPRRPFEGLEQVQRDFEQHRKTVQTLLNNMQAAWSGAVQDGERRAQQILDRIAAKMRTARVRK